MPHPLRAAEGVVTRVDAYLVAALGDAPQQLPDAGIVNGVVTVDYPCAAVGHKVEAAPQTVLFAEVHYEAEGVAQISSQIPPPNPREGPDASLGYHGILSLNHVVHDALERPGQALGAVRPVHVVAEAYPECSPLSPQVRPQTLQGPPEHFKVLIYYGPVQKGLLVRERGFSGEALSGVSI